MFHVKQNKRHTRRCAACWWGFLSDENFHADLFLHAACFGIRITYSIQSSVSFCSSDALIPDCLIKSTACATVLKKIRTSFTIIVGLRVFLVESVPEIVCSTSASGPCNGQFLFTNFAQEFKSRNIILNSEQCPCMTFRKRILTKQYPFFFRKTKQSQFICNGWLLFS